MMSIDTDKQSIDKDTLGGLTKDRETLGSVEKNLFCPDHKVNSEIFKRNYDRIKWQRPKKP
jgi:hypothetical protein